MANRILLQTLLRFSDDIKSGAAKVQDVVTDYFNQTGKSVTDEERGIILKEFQDNAPSNVEEVDFSSDFLFTDKAKSKTPFTDKVKEQNPDVELRGDETFGELTEKLGKSKAEDLSPEALAENLKEKAKTGNTEFDEILDAEFKKAFGKKESKEGLGSLYPKGKTREIFDAANAERNDLAGFMREMRKAGIKNKDVMDVAKITDVAEGKRAATTLARAADMGADTKIKQEFLSELDEKIMDNGPRYFQEEFQGYDSYGELIESKGRMIRNGIVDDLEELGVDDQQVTRIISYANDVAKRNPYQPEAYIEAIKQDLEASNIKYDMSFWENYISKILELSAKPATRFAGGGLV